MRSIPSEGIMLVQGTGSDKSSVLQTIVIVDGEVTIAIENALVLGSDQRSIIASVNDYTGGKVLVILFDELKHVEANKTQLAQSELTWI